jgi:hypothetical protein
MRTSTVPENTPQGGRRVGIEKRFDLAEGYVKTVLGLSTGALVLSVTFLHEIVGIGSAEAPNRIEWKSLIMGAWMTLLVSAVASLFYLYHLAIAAKYESAYSQELKWGAIVSSAGLVCGLVLMSLFAALNLP